MFCSRDTGPPVAWPPLPLRVVPGRLKRVDGEGLSISSQGASFVGSDASCCRFRGRCGLSGHRKDVLPILWRDNAEPFDRLSFGHQLAVVREYHLRTIAGFEADLVDILDLREAVGDERVSQAVPFPFHLRGRADVIEALFIRALEWTDRTRLLSKWCKP